MIIKGTGSYKNVKNGNMVSITGDGGNAWGFYGNIYKKIAPKLYLWKYYDANPDNLSEEDIIDWYIKEFYELRLKNLNVLDFLEILKQKFGEEIILLCHEEPNLKLSKKHFCHRRLLADWIELESGIIVPKLSIDENGICKHEEIYALSPK